MYWLLEAAVYALIVLSVVQIIRLIFADADLHLLFKEKFGKKPESLAGQTIWITGASSGIGEQLAYDLSKIGCKLILSARRPEELERVKKQCLLHGKTKEDDIIIELLDLLDFNSHAAIVQRALAQVSRVDILVNNGGRTQRALVKDTSLEVDKEMMDLNTLGTISLTKALLPHFIENKSGYFVVTSSVAGKVGVPLSASYAAAKFALQGWFNTLRTECSEYNVKVSMICPGPVYSNVLVNAFTGKPGEKHGVEMKKGENRMTTERCTHLMLITMANQIGETWISQNPVLFFTYMGQYTPAVMEWVAPIVGMKLIKKLRQSEETIEFPFPSPL